VAMAMKELTPLQSWALLQARPDTLFVDVRMEIEYLYVGHPPGVVHVAWYEYPTMATDRDDFVRRVRREAGEHLDRPLLLICRSGRRTVDAALALEAAGFTDVAHVRHGFEGELDEHFRRGRRNGWRFDGLPWEQM
jgi:rhodanese-related sulfurtransferase